MAKKFIKNSGSLPFSKAVLSDAKHIMEISGQVGIDSTTGKLAEGIEKQTIFALENIKKILEEVNWSLDNLIKMRIYLVDIKDYSKMNEVYSKYFKENYPARVALAVKGLPLNASIEIEGTASGNFD